MYVCGYRTNWQPVDPLVSDLFNRFLCGNFRYVFAHFLGLSNLMVSNRLAGDWLTNGFGYVGTGPRVIGCYFSFPCLSIAHITLWPDTIETPLPQ